MLQELPEAVAHFSGGFVGKSDSENTMWIYSMRNEVGDSVGEGLGFATTGSRQYQKGATQCIDGFGLCGVEPF